MSDSILIFVGALVPLLAFSLALAAGRVRNAATPNEKTDSGLRRDDGGTSA